MTYHVPYSAAQPGSFAQVPGAYVGQVMRQVGDPVELKVSLLAFYLLSRSREYPGYVMHGELVLKAASLLGVDEASCVGGIEAAVERGVFLKVQSRPGGEPAYFANVESALEAIERLR
jgi:hypothetical protein